MIRSTKPEKGNKYYIRKSSGGYNPCITGKPVDSVSNVLANCVGLAVGFFNECGKYKACKYLGSWNPNTFIPNGTKQGLAHGSVPVPGSIAVWEDHVECVCELVSLKQIKTLSSAYNGYAFKKYTRSKGLSGNWGRNKKFLGFLYQPDLPREVTYTVKSGNTLSQIRNKAKANFGYTGSYKDLAKYNNIPNPNFIRVGQIIRIPLPDV